MSSIIGVLSATAIVALASIYPQETSAESFNGETFLGWSKAQQDSYIQTSVTMASIMATRTHKPSGDCLAAWYLADAEKQNSANDMMRAAISRNVSYHPSSVIYLVLEGECGPFASS